MSTLMEIQDAVEALSLSQKEALAQFLSIRLQEERHGADTKPSRLAEFQGAIHLPTDPLDWQQQMRSEWR